MTGPAVGNRDATRMAEDGRVLVRPVSVAEVLPLIEALTAELAAGGYDESQTFGYSPETLAASDVHLLGAESGEQIVGIGGIEPAGDGTAELKRFYVTPEHRGDGTASAILPALLEYARANDVHTVYLETGNRQHAARRFYTRHGFAEIERFGPYVDSATSICMALTLRP